MPPNWPQTIEAVRQSVVRVHGKLLGTGFLVQGGFYVTASHVVASANAIELETAEGSRSSTRLLNNQGLTSVDLAVLESTLESDSRPLPLGQFSRARVGEEVVFAGYPLEATMPLTFHRAMIAFIGRRAFPPFIDREVSCLQLDGSVNLGNSGGPVINEAGEVLGVINARYGPVTDFLDKFLTEQVESREMLARAGITGGIAAGVAEIEGRTYKQFDTGDAQNALIDIVTMLQKYTNVGIGWAVSSEYISGATRRT